MKNLGDMMKQVQAMQSRMADVQAKLEATTVTGQSGGGLVQVTLNGKGAMTALAVDGRSPAAIWWAAPATNVTATRFCSDPSLSLPRIAGPGWRAAWCAISSITLVAREPLRQSCSPPLPPLTLRDLASNPLPAIVFRPRCMPRRNFGAHARNRPL